MSGDLHAACDSRIMALESALRIANAERDQFRDDIAHATFALMPDTATGVVEADDIVPMIRALRAENERLRAVVAEAQAYLRKYTDDFRENGRHLSADATAHVYRVLAQLDISEPMGGEAEAWTKLDAIGPVEPTPMTSEDLAEWAAAEVAQGPGISPDLPTRPMGDLPPHHVAPGEGIEGYLRRTADENDPANWAFEWPSRERPPESDEDQPLDLSELGDIIHRIADVAADLPDDALAGTATEDDDE